MTRNGYEGIRIAGPDGNRTNIFLDLQIDDKFLKLSYGNKVVNNAKDARLNVKIIRAELDVWNKILGETQLMEMNYSLFIDHSDNKLWKDSSGEFFTPLDLVEYWFARLSTVLPNRE